MSRSILIVAALLVLAISPAAYAIWEVTDTGNWPQSWPAELELLRKQSRSLTGSEANLTFHEIRFTNQEEFETAWPHILKVKSSGAPIVLIRGPQQFLGPLPMGVRIWTPTLQPGQAAPEPKPREGVSDLRLRWMDTTYIELVIDDAIVDLNRIALPEETLVIDRRFEDVGK